MPAPPLLETIDWKAVFDGGKEYDTWLSNAENADHRDRMASGFSSLELTAADVAWLSAIDRPVYVVAIAEDWCGDVVRHAPVIAKLASLAPNVHLRFITRADPSNVFVRFLTNGGEAIPKFVFLSADFVECGSWGPMPAQHRELISRGKAAGNVGAARKKVSALYEMEPNRETVVRELIDLIAIASCTAP